MRLEHARAQVDLGAQALFVTVRTVETHLFNSYRKLGIKSRSQSKPLSG